MKRSDFDNLISQTHNIFEECQQKFYKAVDDEKKCGDAPNHQAHQIFKEMQFHRETAAFCALNALTTARDILNHLGYIEED